MNIRYRGTTTVPHMAPGELCFIQVRQTGMVDVIRGPSPEDFGEQLYKGIVCAIDYSTDPVRVHAVFADPCVTKHANRAVAQLDARQPPFAYMVTPRYRMQGISSFESFSLGDRCLVRIVDWDDRPETLANHGMTPDEIRQILPRELIGIWKARIIFATSTGHEVEGSRLYTVAAVIDDERIRTHENPDVRGWTGLEVPVRYTVWRATAMNQALKEGLDFLDEASTFLSEVTSDLGEDAKELWQELTGR
ncbi:hypothetical protein CO174_03280 [Candidatus Uhrbacteria bacterium CG_4_9_14_3_um_filter_50_9]|uniref:Uncharacterized protein n=1 Tax=Candidatus Uhrbacteria bacterium CG_4_9_14_3_um_filter_50_9 TaxID=1975035 RepID=A0A2M7XBZ9_9BACT|nr:MAG: hypothetical protein CO174_03280 [Candidatus Uhrbacteria bacterium CG_4_9_14_3_um_filter_50_9]